MKINNLFRSIFFENLFIYSLENNKQEILSINFLTINKNLISSNSVLELIANNNSFYCKTINNSVEYNLDFKILEILEFNHINLFKKNGIKVFNRVKLINEERNFSTFILKENKEIDIKINNYLQQITFHEKFFIPTDSVNMSALKCFDYEGNKVWERDFKAIGDFVDPFGSHLTGRVRDIKIVADKVFISVTGHHIFCLDVSTGNTIWVKKLPHGAVAQLALDVYTNSIFVKNQMELNRINLETGEITQNREIVFEWQAKGLISPFTYFTVRPDGLWTTSMNHGLIARINKDTFEIEQTIQMESYGRIPDISPPHITDEFIFQYDGNQGLEIIDRREMKV